MAKLITKNKEYSVHDLWQALHAVTTDVRFFQTITSDTHKDIPPSRLDSIEKLFDVYGPNEFMAMYNNYVISLINFGDIIEVTLIDGPMILGVYVGRDNNITFIRCKDSDAVLSVPKDNISSIKLKASTNVDRILARALSEYLTSCAM